MYQVQTEINRIRLKELDRVLGTTDADVSAGTGIRGFGINAWNGPNLPIGSRIKLITKDGSNQFFLLETLATITTGDRAVSVNPFDADEDIPAGSLIEFDEFNNNDNQYKRINSTHVHFYHTGSTNSNDYLPSFTQFNFNVNSNAVLTDGISKPNRWGSQFAFFIAPDFNCKIERIIAHASSNGGTNEDWKLRYWKKPVNENGSANTDLTLINEEAYTSQNNQNYVFTRRYEPTSGYALDKGDAFLITMAKTGSSKVSSTKFYADIEIITSFYIK